MRMQVGGGVRVMRVKGIAYVYVWHYETVNGGRKPVLEYIGPARNPDSARKAVNAMEEYSKKAISEARRQIQECIANALASRNR